MMIINGIHRGEDLYENDGFIVHFFSKEKVKQLSNGFDIVNIKNFEEGEFARKLFRVTLKKIKLIILIWGNSNCKIVIFFFKFNLATESRMCSGFNSLFF